MALFNLGGNVMDWLFGEDGGAPEQRYRISTVRRDTREKLVNAANKVIPEDDDKEWGQEILESVISAAGFNPTVDKYGRSDMPLLFTVNPSEMSWRMPTRTTIEAVPGGAVHHEWATVGLGSQTPGSRFEHPIVNFTFQTGNISMQNAGRETDDNFFATMSDWASTGTMPPSVGDFYDFLDILKEPDQLPSGGTNYVCITAYTMIFGEINLYGFFTSEGVQWTETADNPNQIASWGASFAIFYSSPNILVPDRDELLINQMSGTYPDAFEALQESEAQTEDQLMLSKLGNEMMDMFT